MNIDLKFTDKRAYLLVTIADTAITVQRAISNFKSINDQCVKVNCRKVLLNALTVEKREIENYEIREVGKHIQNIRIAFLCKPELIDQSARLLGAITFSNGYKVKHFISEDEAANWLQS